MYEIDVRVLEENWEVIDGPYLRRGFKKKKMKEVSGLQ